MVDASGDDVEAKRRQRQFDPVVRTGITRARSNNFRPRRRETSWKRRCLSRIDAERWEILRDTKSTIYVFIRAYMCTAWNTNVYRESVE